MNYNVSVGFIKIIATIIIVNLVTLLQAAARR